jgi:hypothetical protein
LEKVQKEHMPAVSVQKEYPLLKPVTFTNTVDDDYLESLTWKFK